MYIYQDVKLNMKRTVRASLMSIFGINNTRSSLVCILAGFSKEMKMKELSEFDFNILTFLMRKLYWTEADLKDRRNRNLAILLNNQSYRGLRYTQKLPAHANVLNQMLRLIKKNNGKKKSKINKNIPMYKYNFL